MSRYLSFYLLTIFSLSVVMGLQIVVIPWLAVDYLNLSPSFVGLVQAAVLLPNILLIVGGMTADRGLLVNKFLGLLFVYGILHTALLLMLTQHWLTLLWLLLYALLLGCVSAFVQPCKDYILGSLAGNKLQSVIAKNQCAQYLGQAIGIALASKLYSENIIFLPLLQIAFIAVAIALFYFFYRYFCSLNLDRVSKDINESALFSLLLSGFQYCWQSTVLRSLLLIAAVNGFFHIGVFVVALPVLVKVIYTANVGLYGLLQCLFILGTITTTIIVIYKGQLDAPGRRVIFSLLYAGLILLGLSAGPTQYGLMFLIFLWGIVVGISATLSRAILQSQAAAEQRGRVISIYQFALFGFAPLGSLYAGMAIQEWGVLFALKVSAIVSFIAFAALFFTRGLWDIETEDTQATQ